MGEVEMSVSIKASPAEIWQLIGDPTRMGEWSPECQKVQWMGGTTQPALNARFKGHNRYGWRRWSTHGTIVRYEPEREIFWDVDLPLLPIAHWEYRIVPDPDGESCTVIETFRDRRNRVLDVLGPFVRGVKDVDAHNRAGMEETLARIKEAAESRR
jgi:uncharacterized protein YndB with AHSA1/START domain